MKTTIGVAVTRRFLMAAVVAASAALVPGCAVSTFQYECDCAVTCSLSPTYRYVARWSQQYCEVESEEDAQAAILEQVEASSLANALWDACEEREGGAPKLACSCSNSGLDCEPEAFVSSETPPTYSYGPYAGFESPSEECSACVTEAIEPNYNANSYNGSCQDAYVSCDASSDCTAIVASIKANCAPGGDPNCVILGFATAENQDAAAKAYAYLNCICCGSTCSNRCAFECSYFTDGMGSGVCGT